MTLRIQMQGDDRTSSEFSCGDSIWTNPTHSSVPEADPPAMPQQQPGQPLSCKHAHLPCMADELELCAGAIEEGKW